MATDRAPKTLIEAIQYYSDLDVCQKELAEARWPDGVECPTCGSKDVGYLANQRRWQCKGKHPRRQFSVKVGTIFEDSPLSLSKWFAAIWLITNCKNGVSSYEIHRGIGVTQKSAWFMLHRIRLAMQTKSFAKIGGHVEVDETYIGGKAGNMHKHEREAITKRPGHPWAGKVAVMGLLERHSGGQSKMRTLPVQNVRQHMLHGHIRANVEQGSTVYTDALGSYKSMADYQHKVIDHAEKYVDGKVHTNGCENFWSLLKRALRGTYVAVEPFHLFRYLDEQCFRFNERTLTDATRFAEVIRSVSGRRLMYRDLIGKPWTGAAI